MTADLLAGRCVYLPGPSVADPPALRRPGADGGPADERR